MLRVQACIPLLLAPILAKAAPLGYAITITTAFATSDPFPNRIDTAWVEPLTGYLRIANTGATTFTGTIGTIAVSSFAGDLSFTSGTITLPPNGSVSVAIPDNSDDVGGFNGPYYFYRPGVEVTLNGTITNRTESEPVSLLVADRNIHSGVSRVDTFGLVTDSFVLQGGDPWGFQNADAFALTQADGTYVFTHAAPEPGSATVLAAGLTLLAA